MKSIRQWLTYHPVPHPIRRSSGFVYAGGVIALAKAETELQTWFGEAKLNERMYRDRKW